MNLAEKKSHDVLDQMACLKYKCLVMKMRKPTSIYNNFTSFTHSKNIDIMFVYYDKGHSKLGTLKSHHGIFRPQSDVISKIYPCQTHPYERSAKPQLKNAISGQSYRFWDFTISFYSISWLHHLHPLANCVRKAFLHLHFSVWSMLEEVWMSSHSDMFHAFHSFPIVWVANHHHGPMLLPWLSSSRRKIAKPDLQAQVCRCARDEPGLTKAMGRRKRICIAAKRSQ